MSRQAVDFYNYFYSEKADFSVDLITVNSIRELLPVFTDYYLAQLSDIKPCTFALLTAQEKTSLRQQLIMTIKLLNAQYELNQAEERFYTRNRPLSLANLACYMQDCYALIEKIDQSTANKPLLALEPPRPVPTHHVYTGATIYAENLINSINARRLYWVWGGGSINSLSCFFKADHFFNLSHAQRVLNQGALYSSYLSFILYYLRFAINFGLLLKHVIGHPWMDPKEKELDWFNVRLKNQLWQRGLGLINDLFWATANLVCFFWLCGSGAMGYAGNILTAGLLVMDIVISLGRCWQAWKLNQQQTLVFDSLDKQLTWAKIGKSRDEQQLLDHQLDHLKRLRAQTDLDWRFNKLNLANDVTYGLALLLSFSLMCCFFCPPAMIAPSIAMIIGFIGAVLSFVLTIASSLVKSMIEVSKFNQLIKNNEQAAFVLLTKFNQCDNADIDAQRLIYRQLLTLVTYDDYYRRMIRYQTISLVYALIKDALIPAVVFAGLVFLPTGVGIGFLAISALLTLAVNNLIERLAPEKLEPPHLEQAPETKIRELKPHNNNLALQWATLKTAVSPQLFFAHHTKKLPANDAEMSVACVSCS